ncbi:oligopeptide ABC transporter ATP-binding protein [Stutzerimonas nosocomialis]|uniref:ABC transporter ATP-binding protein n=1 Tax=Stutzerimonas nosocomialis TaxID=1056496 RepID=UPI001108DF50|nr:oligopeptide/dipeptide ABC transporter ATP-binding protein [Stutzerimonas nosocomialis]TLX53618.1 oligopeptide ABC transporter ATP-binding protein [Stutzerimonas nosocomialis]
MKTPDKPILEGHDLTKHFTSKRGFLQRAVAPVRAVDAVSLSVRRGETLALVGESGSGKSTLGRLLLNLLEPTAGDVIYEGRNLGNLSAQELRKVRQDLQIIFQDPFASLNPRMTVQSIVGEPIWLHDDGARSEREDRVAELLRTVGLAPEHAERYPHEFSGGQRQRIGIARALASRPKLLLGDEPVSALDVSVQAQVVNLLEDLKLQFGLTLVIVAHGLAVIRHMSDRVAVMYLGEIVELAPVDALFEQPLHPYSQALIDSVPVSHPRDRRARQVLGGDMPSPSSPPPGCRFHTRCPHARALCRESRPALEKLPDDRQVACHFWREIASAGSGNPIVVTPSTAFSQRLALFKARQSTLTEPHP